MAWIEVHQSLPQHRKIKRLKRALKITEPQAVGHMIMLWLWCIDNASDGCLDKMCSDDIAEAAGWPKGPDIFLQALIQAGFVDQGDHLLIHDWQEYTGASLEKRNEKREQNRERQQRYRESKRSVTSPLRNADGDGKVTQDNALRNANVTRDTSVMSPLRNAPNLTLPNLTLPKEEDVYSNNTISRARESVTPPPPPPKKSRAVDAYMAKINPSPSSASMTELLEFEKELGADVCVRAIDVALDANARTWPYVRAVLRAKKEQGIRSIEDWDRAEADRMNAKARTGGKAQPAPEENPCGYAVPPEEDFADLDRLIAEMQEKGQYPQEPERGGAYG